MTGAEETEEPDVTTCPHASTITKILIVAEANAERLDESNGHMADALNRIELMEAGHRETAIRANEASKWAKVASDKAVEATANANAKEAKQTSDNRWFLTWFVTVVGTLAVAASTAAAIIVGKV